MKKITSLKTLSLLISLFCAVGFGYGQTTLVAGDIAITGFNSGAPSQLTFVLLKDVTNTTQIKFTDNGWNLTTGLRTTEGTLTWQATSDLPCGTEIFLERVTNANLTASYGTVSAAGGFALNTVSDQILAYQGASSSPNFINSIHYGSAGWSDAIDSATTAIPPGLTNGINAVYFANNSNGNYNCTVTTNQVLTLAAVSAATNWNISTTRYSTLGGCTYTCVPCPTTTTWNGTTWSAGTPDINKNAIIAANYNTTTNASFSACSLTVNAGFNLRVTNGHYVEVENDVVVNGNIIVDNHGAFKQNSNTSTYTHGLGGTSVVRKETSILNNWYDYTYWCSPISGLTIGTSPLTDSTMRHWFDASKYEDILAETGNSGVFSTGHDDIDDNGDDWTFAYDSFPMNPGVGFAATHSQTGYSGARQYTYEFYGIFNNGPLSASIFYNGANGDKDWNLIGNPYPCALDFNAFYAVNSGVVDGAAYLWSHRTAIDPNASGNEAYNFSQNDYAIITAGSGSIYNSDNGDGIVPNDYIPSGQGFFISGLAIGVVNFDNSMRMADATSNNQFFKSTNNKSKSNDVANKIWVNLTSDNGVFNQVLVAYVDGATNDNDGMAYDATRMLSSGASSIIYTLIGDDNTNKFAIQGKAVNSLGPDETIKLGFYTSISSATLYKFTLAHIQGDFLNNHAIFLKDHLLNKVHCLSTSDYSFTSEVGEFNNRFEIAFSNQALSVEDALLNKNALTIVQLENDEVQFTATNNLNIKNVAIFDLLGRQLYQFTGNSNQETYKLSNLHNSVFVAKVTLSNGGVIAKKAFKK